jgi:hypothetical protein
MSFTDIKIEGGKFLKIDSGESVDIHILSQEPVKQVIHGFGMDKVNCIGKNCNMCEEGETPKQRWLVNVWDRKDQKVRVFEFGPAIARQIKAIAEMLQESKQTVHDVDFRIKAEGSGLNKEYTVIQKPMGGAVPDNVTLYKLV